ncbi:MAG: hypothetical protein AB1422_10515 [bacterium]
MGWVEWLMIDWVEDYNSLSASLNRLKMSNDTKGVEKWGKMAKSS